MKKILIVSHSAWQLYNFRLNLANSIKKDGHEVIFIAPEDGKYSDLIKEDFSFFNVSIDAKGVNPLNDLYVMVSLYRLFKDIKPDIILSFAVKPNIYSAIISCFLGINSISNITGLGTVFIEQTFVTNVVKLLYMIALNFNDKVFFQNKDDRQLFIESRLVQEDKCELLPGSGVDLNKFIPLDKSIDNKNFKFLFIARLLRDKGVFEFIEAIKIIKTKYSNVEFQMLGAVGVDNKTAISKNELKSWTDDKLVTYLGTTDYVEKAIFYVDCVILPSYREGTPRCLLEACAMEKPVIATDVVGCKEVVDDGVNGYLCEVRNSCDLAKKIELMINLSDEQRYAMGRAGRKKIVNEFDEQIVIDKYLQSLEEILK